jgi:hypothetical protein
MTLHDRPTSAFVFEALHFDPAQFKQLPQITIKIAGLQPDSIQKSSFPLKCFPDMCPDF